MSATFSSTLISDSTRANEIDDRVMDLLRAIVAVLGDADTFGTDHAVLQPIFDWYESGSSEGYFGTIRMRGSATQNGIRIRDMVNSKEFRVTLADGASTPALKIQYNTGSEVSPSWTNLLTVTQTDLIYHPGFDGTYETNGNIQGYIDAIRQELIDAINGIPGGGLVDSVSAAAGSGLDISPTTGNVIVDFTEVNRDAAYSLQVIDGGGTVGWAEQACPAHAFGTGYEAAVTLYNNTENQIDLSSISCNRGAMGLNGGGVDVVRTGTYLVTASVIFLNDSGVAFDATLAVRNAGSGFSYAATHVPINALTGFTATGIVEATGTNGNFTASIYQNSGADRNIIGASIKMSVVRIS